MPTQFRNPYENIAYQSILREKYDNSKPEVPSQIPAPFHQQEELYKKRAQEERPFSKKEDYIPWYISNLPLSHRSGTTQISTHFTNKIEPGNLLIEARVSSFSAKTECGSDYVQYSRRQFNPGWYQDASSDCATISLPTKIIILNKPLIYKRCPLIESSL